jgi:hypothetical protein
MIKPLFERKIRVKPFSIDSVKIWTFLTPASRKRGEGDRATETGKERERGTGWLPFGQESNPPSPLAAHSVHNV